MKKLTLLITLFIFSNLFAQGNNYETQITYKDLNHVSTKIEAFLNDNYTMQIDDTNFNLKDGTGEITQIYKEQIAINKNVKAIKVTYNVFTLKNEFIIKEASITGSNEIVIGFYISFWNTNLNFDDIKDKEIASNRYFQDRISLSNSTIKITNTSIKSIADFKPIVPGITTTNYDHNKNKETVVKPIKQRFKKYTYSVEKKKKTLKYKQTRKHFADEMGKSVELKTALNEFMKSYKKGTYLVKVIYLYTGNEVTKIDFKTL